VGRNSKAGLGIGAMSLRREGIDDRDAPAIVFAYTGELFSHLLYPLKRGRTSDRSRSARS